MNLKLIQNQALFNIARIPAIFDLPNSLLTISWCKKRKRAGEVQMCEPSRFITELPNADVRHFGNPFNDPEVSKEFGKSKMAGIRAMLNKA